MTSPRQKARGPRQGWMGLMAGAALAAAPLAASASSAVDLYYERTVMTAADGRCRLFEPAVGSALAAAQAQARGAALRAGVDNASLKAVEGRARAKAAGAACASKDLDLAAGRVRTAFEGYAKLIRMSYPGDLADWRADRSTSRETPLWRLAQAVSFGPDRMTFGLAGKQAPGVLLASVNFADGKVPYTARMVLRDTARTSQPYLNRRLAAPAGKIPLTGRTPPRAMAQAFAAEARSPSEALLPAGAKAGWSFRFPTAAADALAALDPREAIIVEFVFAGRAGDEVRQAYVEVGDFAAGRAFLKTAQR